jgi:hypothetical protein
MGANNNKVETSTFVKINGEIPADSYLSQNVMIGYSEDGLYADTSQKVDVAFYSKGNIIAGLIIPQLMPVQFKDKYEIVDIESDGTLLSYNIKNNQSLFYQ